MFMYIMQNQCNKIITCFSNWAVLKMNIKVAGLKLWPLSGALAGSFSHNCGVSSSVKSLQ